MNKADRSKNGVSPTARKQCYERQEKAMASFIDTCRTCMTPEQWNLYYPEAKRSAGETLHVVTDLIFALGRTQTPIVPKLRHAIESIIDACGIDRNRWTDPKGPQLRPVLENAIWVRC